MGYFVIYQITTLALIVGTFAIDYPPVKRDETLEEDFFGTKVKALHESFEN